MKRDKVAVVTGGAGGIGAAIGMSLGLAGAVVILTDLDGDKLKDQARVLQREGVACEGVQADLTSTAEVHRLELAVSKFAGACNVLVNSVGIVKDALLHKVTLEDWNQTLATNLTSYLLCSQAFTPGMREQGFGRIVNVSSRAWLGGYGQASYSASKGGVISLTRTLALELAKDNITVNAVAPGVIDTPMFRNFRPDVQKRLIKLQPSGRIGSPDDVANAVEFFADEKSGFITGQTLYVCGGKSLAAAPA